MFQNYYAEQSQRNNTVIARTNFFKQRLKYTSHKGNS